VTWFPLYNWSWNFLFHFCNLIVTWTYSICADASMYSFSVLLFDELALFVFFIAKYIIMRGNWGSVWQHDLQGRSWQRPPFTPSAFGLEPVHFFEVMTRTQRLHFRVTDQCLHLVCFGWFKSMLSRCKVCRRFYYLNSKLIQSKTFHLFGRFHILFYTLKAACNWNLILSRTYSYSILIKKFTWSKSGCVRRIASRFILFLLLNASAVLSIE